MTEITQFIYFQNFSQELTACYAEGEANAITRLVAEEITGKNFVSVRFDNNAITANQKEKAEGYLQRLLMFEPIQQVLGYAEFMGMKMEVNRHVLIPRPETEELVASVIKYFKATQQNTLTFLDACTGSGCIAIALAKAFPEAKIFATDIDANALQTAQRNAVKNKEQIEWLQHDLLQTPLQLPMHSFDAIISNPPYIKPSEAKQMDQHVLQFEPALALFAPEDDPLIFYNALARIGNQHLKSNGLLAVEINRQFGTEIAALFNSQEYENISIHQDLQHANRFVFAHKA